METEVLTRVTMNHISPRIMRDLKHQKTMDHNNVNKLPIDSLIETRARLDQVGWNCPIFFLSHCISLLCQFLAEHSFVLQIMVVLYSSGFFPLQLSTETLLSLILWPRATFLRKLELN